MYNEESLPTINNNHQSKECTLGFIPQDQTNINLLNFYNNSSIEWCAGFTQAYEDQINNSFSQDQTIELSTDITNNNPFMEWNENIIQTNTRLLNINNPIMELFAGITRNDENQINHNLSTEWTTCFTQDQTNSSLLNIYNTGITQHYEGQVNNLHQQFDVKSVKKNEHPFSLVSK
ncbi:7928_t:CDS:2, partial [Dentiscutata erythropus]